MGTGLIEKKFTRKLKIVEYKFLYFYIKLVVYNIFKYIKFLLYLLC
jgi:hypothetical protein